jgi:hypothetical protein
MVMSLIGTVVKGVIVLDGNPPLPEGARVRVLLDDDELDDLPLPSSIETHEEHLAALRESIEDMKAGRTRPAREILKEIALRHNLPLEPGE